MLFGLIWQVIESCGVYLNFCQWSIFQLDRDRRVVASERTALKSCQHHHRQACRRRCTLCWSSTFAIAMWGALLGSVLPDGTVDIRNSYAVPQNESSDLVCSPSLLRIYYSGDLWNFYSNFYAQWLKWTSCDDFLIENTTIVILKWSCNLCFPGSFRHCLYLFNISLESQINDWNHSGVTCLAGNCKSC